METAATYQQHHPLSPSSVVVVGIERMGVNPKHPDYSSVDDDNIHSNTKHDRPIQIIMDESKRVMEEWNTTIVPKVQPLVNATWEQVKDIKKQTIDNTNTTENVEHHPASQSIVKNHNDGDDEAKKERDDYDHDVAMLTNKKRLGILFKQTLAMEQQIQTLYEQLHQCKVNLQRAAFDTPDDHVVDADHDVGVDPVPAATAGGGTDEPAAVKHMTNPISKVLSPIFGHHHPIRHHHHKRTNEQHMVQEYYERDFLHHYETATVEYQTVTDVCQHILLSISNTTRCQHPSK